MAQKKYEYKIECAPAHESTEEVCARLDELGRNGWMVTHVSSIARVNANSSVVTLLLMREVE